LVDGGYFEKASNWTLADCPIKLRHHKFPQNLVIKFVFSEKGNDIWIPIHVKERKFVRFKEKRENS